MREAKAVSAQESSQLRAVSCSPLPPLAYLGVTWGALQGLAFLGFQVLYVMSSPPSLLASLRLGYLSPGALSHLPTPRPRKPVLTCWLTLVETPLLLPRQDHHLLHSQPLGVSGTWDKNLTTTYVPLTQKFTSPGDQVLLGPSCLHMNKRDGNSEASRLGGLGSKGYQGLCLGAGAPGTFF